MARKLYYQDSYGRWHQEKTAGHPRGLPGGFMVKVLMWLAIAVVIASFIGH